MTQQNGWVFGWRGDALVFTGPIILSLFFFYLHAQKLWGMGEIQPHFALIQIYINLAHLYSTFWYTYTSPFQWSQHGKWFVGVPLLIFVLHLCLIQITSHTHVYLIFTHFSMWHFIKQQQAWFHIAAGRGVARDKWTQKIDHYAIVCATLGFVIASQCGPESRGWFRNGDIVELPTLLYWPALIISVTGVISYLLRHTYLIIKRIPANWAAHHVFLCSTIIWGYVRLAPQHVLAYYFYQLHHAIPYFLLGYRHMQSERSLGRSYWLPHLPMWLLGIGILVISGLQGHFEMNMRAGQGLISNSPDLLDPLGGGAGALAFFNAINITHYVIDMFYWNRKHNPEWTNALG